jgi:hypothetical protein
MIPYLLKFLCKAACPTDPRLQKMTYHTFILGSSWHWPLQGRQTHSIPKHLRGMKKPSVRFWMKVVSNGNQSFGLISFQSWFPFLKLVVMSKVK